MGVSDRLGGLVSRHLLHWSLPLGDLGRLFRLCFLVGVLVDAAVSIPLVINLVNLTWRGCPIQVGNS